MCKMVKKVKISDKINHFFKEQRRDSQDLDGPEDMGGEEASGGDTGELREQDRFLPIANVARIMKKSIPSSQGKIAKDARECVQECVSEFISFITSEASDRCQVVFKGIDVNKRTVKTYSYSLL